MNVTYTVEYSGKRIEEETVINELENDVPTLNGVKDVSVKVLQTHRNTDDTIAEVTITLDDRMDDLLNLVDKGMSTLPYVDTATRD